MRIKMLVSVAADGFSVAPQEETDRFSEAEAARFVASGQAVPVAAPIERAVKAPVEKRKRK